MRYGDWAPGQDDHFYDKWYEAFADAAHALGKKWPDQLTPEEEGICEKAADKVAPRPESEK